MSLPSRRSIIAAAASIATAGLAGCSAAPLSRQSTPECDEMHEAIVNIKEVSLSSAKREDVDLLQYSNLPDAEQEIVRTATKEDQYRECMGSDGFSERLYSFRDRVSEHATENHHAYLTYQETTYAVALRLGDAVYTDLPDSKTVTQDQ